MPRPLILSVVIGSIADADLLHEKGLAEIGVVHQQMDVILHEAVGADGKTAVCGISSEQIQKIAVIFRFFKENLYADPSDNQMVIIRTASSSCLSCHIRFL